MIRNRCRVALKRGATAVLLLGIVILTAAAVARAAPDDRRSVLFRDNFANLENWKPFLFPKIKKHSVYSVQPEGDRHELRAESNASASAIVFKESYPVRRFPRVRWRWKVDNVYGKGATGTKAGDDYPLRVYIMFEYDPAKAGAFEKMKYGLVKSLYGEYPPQSSLNYVWANKEQAQTIVTSPYTDRAKMILLQQGAENVGTWQDEDVDVVKDYQKAFGTEPPDRARIAIMNDSDNTGEHSVSYMEYIEVYRE